MTNTHLVNSTNAGKKCERDKDQNGKIKSSLFVGDIIVSLAITVNLQSLNKMEMLLESDIKNQ